MNSIEDILNTYFNGEIQNVTRRNLHFIDGIDPGVKNELIELKKKYNKDKRNEENKQKISLLLNDIHSINVDGLMENLPPHETQQRSNIHENECYRLLCQHFQATELDPSTFRTFISKNERQWINNNGDSLIDNPVASIPIIHHDNLNMNVTYVIKQPSGSQRYPDIAMIKLTPDNYLQIAYIECKQIKPTWNNTPPKRCSHCIYICGSEIFNGELITSANDQLMISNYINDYTDLVSKYNELTDIFKFVRYKKIELKQWPTQHFIDRQGQNIPLITDTLLRFVCD